MAHSWNHTSIAEPRGRAARTFSSSVAKPFFERLQRFGVLRMVAGPRREPDMAELSEFPAHGRFVQRDRKFRMEPQIPHEATGPGRSAASARPRGPPASERSPRSPQAPDVGCRLGLQTHAADPRRIAATAAITDPGQRRQPAALLRGLRFPGQTPQCRPVKVRPEFYCCTHGHAIPTSSTIESDCRHLGNPPRVSLHAAWYYLPCTALQRSMSACCSPLARPFHPRAPGGLSSCAGFICARRLSLAVKIAKTRSLPPGVVT